MERSVIHDVEYERPEDNVNKAEYYIQQLNVNNAKKVALCLVLGFICYHGLIHLRYGQFSYTSDQFFTSLHNQSHFRYGFLQMDFIRWPIQRK